MISRTLAVLGLAASLALTATAARADELSDIKAKGVITIGIKADYPPFGFLSPSGDNIGIEPDLGRDLAQRLGVKAQFVVVVGSNRMQFLNQGKIDIIIATMSDTPEREKIIDIVHPDYYASGYNLMLAKTVPVTSWSQLKGEPICGIQSSYYNKAVAEKYGAEIVAFTGTAEALAALRQGRCNGFLYDDTAIEGKISTPEWSGYGMPLPSQDDKPWGMGIKQGEPAFDAFLSQTVIAWDKSGLIISLEKKYGAKPSVFAAAMHKKYQ
jgi:polar amino acid transport system substrate-binding protein